MLASEAIMKKIRPVVGKEEHEIEDLIRYVQHLMKWYSHKPSLYLANNIVSKLEQIKERKEDCECGPQDWECERLIKKWCYLAQARRPFTGWSH